MDGSLIELGGMQNTFGVALLGGIGTGTTVDAGVGVSGSPQIIGTGEFSAPVPAGLYVFRLERTVVNVLLAAGAAPEYTFVRPALVDVSQGELSFQVRCFADLTGDGMVNLDDIEAFSAGFLAGDPIADCDGSGVLSLDDIECFTAAFLAGCP